MKALFTVVVLMVCMTADATRVKDLASIQGVRDNQLLGYGLVVGLDGTGDTESFTKQSFRNMLNRLGVTIPADITPNIKNVAAVALHATLPAFTKPGQSLDVTVSSIGNAKSLRGGTLLMAPLKAADGQVYALAQGNLIVGGLSAQGLDGSKIAVNVPVVGRIPNGALVERGVPNPFGHTSTLIYNLHRSDFTTAKRLTDAVNDYIGKGAAVAIDATSIKVNIPENEANKVMFVSTIENLQVRPGETAAKVIVNSRTGTIVIGKYVKVGPAAIAHGNLTVTITENPEVSQPNALSDGATTVTNSSEVVVTQDNSRMFLLQPDVKLDSIVSAVNKVGAAPSDLMAILEALKQAGALTAELEII